MDFPPTTSSRLPLQRASSWLHRGPGERGRAVPRLSLQTDLCLPNGLRQWSGENTIEKDQTGRERERDMGKSVEIEIVEDDIRWKKFCSE